MWSLRVTCKPAYTFFYLNLFILKEFSLKKYPRYTQILRVLFIMTKIPGIDVEPIENFEFAKERRLFYVDFTRARFETNLVCENKNL